MLLARSVPIYVLLPLFYAFALVGFYLATGRLLQFLPAVFILATVPVALVMQDFQSFWKPWVALGGILLSYEALAGTIGSAASSIRVFSVYQLDKALWGFNLTGWVQSALLSRPATELAALLYSLHLPLVAVTSLVLWYTRRRLFGKYVTAIAITSYLSLTVFVLMPTSPPWNDGTAVNLLGSGTSFSFLGPIASLSSLIESDKFAAFPSLHAAYAILFGFYISKLGRGYSVIAVPLAAGILFSTIYLGQHYLVDLIGGASIAAFACLLSNRYQLFSLPDARASPSGLVTSNNGDAVPSPRACGAPGRLRAEPLVALRGECGRPHAETGSHGDDRGPQERPATGSGICGELHDCALPPGDTEVGHPRHH